MIGSYLTKYGSGTKHFVSTERLDDLVLKEPVTHLENRTSLVTYLTQGSGQPRHILPAYCPLSKEIIENWAD